MGKRHDLPKIKPDEKPSLINHEAGKWGVLGLLMSIVPAIFVQGKSKWVTGITSAGLIGGTLYGAISGKAHQEKEQIEGRVVKTPGYWNKGLLSGLTVSGLLEAPLLLAGKKLPLAGLITAVAATIGSIMRKNSLQRDFDKSVAIRDANHAKTQQLLEAAIANQNNPPLREEEAVASFKNSVTPDEAALLMEKQAQAAAPVVEKPAHGPEHKPHTDHAAHSDAHAPEHHAAHGEHHSEHQGEHHDAPSHAAKHEQQQHTGSHAAKHEPAASHTDHAEKHDAGMAMSA